MPKSKIKFKTSDKPEDYNKVVEFMEDNVAKIVAQDESELIYLTSHKPLYTAGISSKEEDLLSNDLPVFKTNRGGKYTYHDDGMRIIYVMLNLKNVFAPEKPDVAKFVEMLENWVIAVLARIGIKGEIRKDRVGIWVECLDTNGQKTEKKIAAMGIKIRKWVSYHGIAINIEPNLEGFSGIVPCGLKNFGVTSIKDLGSDFGDNVGKEILFSKIDQFIQEEFFKIFQNYS
ncbi:MAG: lipoyl(octanoyl) transferase [Rickettsiales bacterium]|jgi:lipoyl(octanoyl) transferase